MAKPVLNFAVLKLFINVIPTFLFICGLIFYYTCKHKFISKEINRYFEKKFF